MKLLNYVILTIIMVAFYSCSSMDEPQAPDQVEETKVPAISQEEAVSVAMNAMKNFGFLSQSRSEVSASDVEVTTHRSEKEDTAFYVISYPEGGFVAVDANSEALAKVLAISDTGDISPIGIEYLSNSRPRKAAPGITIEPGLPITPGNISKVYRHFTPEWRETYPFNTEFEMGLSAGTGTVAIGETLAYFKKSIMVDGKPFDWTDIDPYNLNDESQKKVNRLLWQISLDMGGGDFDNYELDFDDIAEGLTQYGYNKCSYFTLTTDVNFANQFVSGPVLANVHLSKRVLTWVVDAIEYTEETLQTAIGIGGSNLKIIEMYCHMNWGFGGKGNGYFLTYYFDSSKDIDEIYDWEVTSGSSKMVVVPENTKFLRVK